MFPSSQEKAWKHVVAYVMDRDDLAEREKADRMGVIAYLQEKGVDLDSFMIMSDSELINGGIPKYMIEVVNKVILNMSGLVR